MLLLPWDLFKFSIDIKCDSVNEMFLKFALNIYNSKGWNFNQHFMHHKLWIHNIYIESDYAQKLWKYLEILKSIETVADKHQNKYDLRSENHTLFDKLSFKDKHNFIMQNSHFTLPKLIKEDEQDIYNTNEIFRRVFFVYLVFNKTDESLSILKDIGDLEIKIDNYKILCLLGFNQFFLLILIYY